MKHCEETIETVVVDSTFYELGDISQSNLFLYEVSLIALAENDDDYYIDFAERWIDSGESPDPAPGALGGFMTINLDIPNVWKCPSCKAGYAWVNSSGTTLSTYKTGECKACS